MAGGGEGVDGKVSAVVVKVCLWEDTGFMSMQVCAVLSENPVGSAILLGLCRDCAAPVGDEVTLALHLLKLGSVEAAF